MTAATPPAEATNGFAGKAGWVLYQLAASPYFVIINILIIFIKIKRISLSLSLDQFYVIDLDHFLEIH